MVKLESIVRIKMLINKHPLNKNDDDFKTVQPNGTIIILLFAKKEKEIYLYSLSNIYQLNYDNDII